MTILTEIPFGSRVYGTYDENSDMDSVIIVDNENHQLRRTSDNKIWTINEFRDHLFRHYIIALEIWNYDQLLLKSFVPEGFTIDIHLLRQEISTVSSNSWVKAKKKINVEATKYPKGSSEYKKEIRKGMKSIFHSFRIIQFGIQLAKYGKIVDFSSANSIFESIKNMEVDELNNVLSSGNSYHQMRNNLLTDFRKLALKEQI